MSLATNAEVLETVDSLVSATEAVLELFGPRRPLNVLELEARLNMLRAAKDDTIATMALQMEREMVS